MAGCLRVNYNNRTKAWLDNVLEEAKDLMLDVRGVNNRRQTFTEYLTDILDPLSGNPAFATCADLSTDPEHYVASITGEDGVIGHILDFCSTDEELKKVFTTNKSIEALRQSLVDAFGADAGSAIREELRDHVFNNVEILLSTRNIGRTYDLEQAYVYGELASAVNGLRVTDFGRDMVRAVIANFDDIDPRRIYDDNDICRALSSYLDLSPDLLTQTSQTVREGQYQKIRKFLISLGIDDRLICPTMFFKLLPGLKFSISEQQDQANNALVMMSTIIDLMKENGTLNSTLYQSYLVGVTKNALLLILQQAESSKEEAQKESDQNLDALTLPERLMGSELFYEAVNAYMNILYFDEQLKRTLKGVIKINQNMNVPLYTLLMPDGSLKKVYKYSLSSDGTSVRRVWGVDAINTFDELGDFSKLLMSIIPVYDYTFTDSRSYLILATPRNRYMVERDFIGSFTALKEAVPKLNVVTDSPLAMRTFVSEMRLLHHSKEHLKKALEALFTITYDGTRINDLGEEEQVTRRHGIQRLHDALIKLGVDHNMLNNIYSAYRMMYLNDNSMEAIEQKFRDKRGMKFSFNMIDCLYGVIRSNVAVPYVFTGNLTGSALLKTDIRQRMKWDRPVWNMVEGINNSVIDRLDKMSMLSLYHLTLDGNTYTITSTGDNAFRVSFRFDERYTLLDKNNARITFLDTNNVDLTKKDYDEADRRRLFLGVGLNPGEAEYMNALRFIDNMFGTALSRSMDGLRTLHTMAKMDNGAQYILHMFVSAVRALNTMSIYANMEQSLKPDTKTRYDLTEIRDYLKDTNSTLANLWEKEYRNQRHNNFFSRDEGDLLRSVEEHEAWLRAMFLARAIISGRSIDYTVKNALGDNMPSYSPTYLGAELDNIISDITEGSAAHANIFTRENVRGAIVLVAVDSDVTTRTGVKRASKRLVEGELILDRVVNKFILPLLDANSRSVYILPTVVADKSKIPLVLINLDRLMLDGNTSMLLALQRGDLLDQLSTLYAPRIINETLREMDRRTFANILEDYRKIGVDVESAAELLSWLKNNTETHLIDLVRSYNIAHSNDLVKILRNLHYRVDGDAMTMNEMLFESSRNFGGSVTALSEAVGRRLDQERINFITLLANAGVHFNMRYSTNGQETKPVYEDNPILGYVLGILKIPVLQWVEGSRVILAKVTDSKGILYNVVGRVIPSDIVSVELNPALEAYFLVNSILALNLHALYTGSHMGIDKNPAQIERLNLTKSETSFIRKRARSSLVNSQGQELPITMADIGIALDAYETATMNTGNDEKIATALREKYEKELRRIEGVVLVELMKRDLILTSTTYNVALNKETGVRPYIRVAVIEDILGEGNNYYGDKLAMEGWNGAAFVTGTFSLHLNNSFNDRRVLGSVIKPILHAYDERTNSAQLLKFDVVTLSNEMMRNSLMNDVSLLDVYRKMAGERWNGSVDLYNFYDNITTLDANRKRVLTWGKRNLNFSEDITQGGDLYYVDSSGLHHVIDGLLRSHGDYFTLERSTDNKGNRRVGNDGGLIAAIHVYHYFDDDGNHYCFNSREERAAFETNNNIKLHTIDSMYELYLALGGMYSESLDNRGFLVYSENNQRALANFMNIVKDENHKLILKEKEIDMLCPRSAFKRGHANINPVSSLKDNTALLSMEIPLTHYGLLLDSDHAAEEAVVREMSLMVNALDSNGKMHSVVSLIYRALGRVTLERCEVFTEAVKAWNTSKSLLQEVAGRAVIANFTGTNRSSLTAALINTIAKEFNINADHVRDAIKIPYSDPAAYSLLLLNLTSVLNRSVVHYYAGISDVIVPSYGLRMIWLIGGKYYQYDDLVRAARDVEISDNITDIALANRAKVNTWLLARLTEEPIYVDDDKHYNRNRFLIGDRVYIYATLDGLSEKFLVDLEKLDDYHLFQDDPRALIAQLNSTAERELTKDDIGIEPLSFLRAIDRPRNLRLQVDVFTYIVDGEEHVMSMHNHPKVREGLRTGNLALVDLAFDEIANHKFIDLDGIEHRVTKLETTPLEMLMSNIYSARFDTKGRTLRQALDMSEKEIEHVFKRNTNLASSIGKYDVAFTTVVSGALNCLVSFEKLFGRKQRIRNITTDIIDDAKVKGRIYAIDDAGRRLFEIGRYVVAEGVREENGRFIDSEGVELPNLNEYSVINGIIVHRLDFVQQAQRKALSATTLQFYINRGNLDGILFANEDINLTIADILYGIYESGDYDGMLFASSVTPETDMFLRGTLSRLRDIVHDDDHLLEYIGRVVAVMNDNVHEVTKNEGTDNPVTRVKYGARRLAVELNTFRKALAREAYASLHIALEYVGSRIPGQTLSTFFKGLNIGYLDVPTNQVMVSLQNLYLQGSDFDNDKNNLIGYAFDGAGRFIGWSRLFDLSSVLNLRASMLLPLPTGKVYKGSSNGERVGHVRKMADNVRNARNSLEKINMYVTLLNYLESNNFDALDLAENDEVLQAINRHEASNVSEDGLKNFISSRFLMVASDLRTLPLANLPIDIPDLVLYSENANGTLSNPLFIAFVQVQNLVVGKDGVAIMANGEKGYQMWNTRSQDVAAGRISKEFGNYEFKTSRIRDRAAHPKNPKAATTTFLPGIKIEGEQLLTPSRPVDYNYAQYVTAATDNAKLLVAYQINASENMAAKHLALIALGYDVADIVAFMTCPAVQFITAMTQSNIFDTHKVSLKIAMNAAKGKYNGLWHLYISPKRVSDDIKKKLDAGDVEHITIPSNLLNDKTSSDYINLMEAINAVAEAVHLRRSLGLAADPEGTIADVDEFNNVSEYADEFSTFALMLKLNRGVPSTRDKLQAYVLLWMNTYSDMVSRYNKNNTDDQIEETTLDIVRFVNDSAYNHMIKTNAEKAKKVINMFAIIDDIPLYHAYLLILAATVLADHVLSVKSRLLDKVTGEFGSLFRYISEDYQKRLVKAVDQVIITEFLRSSDNDMVYPLLPTEASKRFDSSYNLMPYTTGQELRLDNPANIATFKYNFENMFIPYLKQGKVIDFAYDGNMVGVTTRDVDALATNLFVLLLHLITDDNVPKYALPINMNEIDYSLQTRIQYNELLLAFKELRSITVAGKPLTDWFALYNLVVNHNYYGENKLTTLLESLVEEEGSFLRRYYQHVGLNDTNDDELDPPYSMLDIKRTAAKKVQSIYYLKDPSYMVMTTKGPQWHVKGRDGRYSAMDNIVVRRPGMTDALYALQLGNFLKYFTLGGTYADVVLSLVENINNITSADEKAIAQAVRDIRDWMRLGILNITKKC